MDIEIIPTAVVFHNDFSGAEIFTNEADLRRHLVSYDGYIQHFKIENDLLYVCNARHGERKYWEPTSVDFGGCDENTLTEDMEREAIMQIWGKHDYYKLAGTDNVRILQADDILDIYDSEDEPPADAMELYVKLKRISSDRIDADFGVDSP